MMQSLAERMRVQRMFWVDVPHMPGHRVQLLRPTETEVLRDIYRVGGGVEMEVQDLHRHAVGWEGFTEADLLGAVGSDAVAPFSAETFDAWAQDHADLAAPLARELLVAVAAHFKAREDAAKNYAPS